ncbi:MAG: EFR1 family ferrodoxin [Lachnospiraceae bacterium]|nr:EFR1 family ferrodoxin [Lachnospiraceae bacterium]
MKIKQVTGIYFSPTKSTKNVVMQIAGQFGGNQAELDLTDANRNRPDYHFLENEVIVVGAPVYGGRLPVTAAERLRKLHGHQTPAVLVVVYGNRAYEDALLELKEILTEQGFVPAAAIAAVAEHNIIRSIAAGRPDAKDQEMLTQFGQQAAKQLEALARVGELHDLSVPGHHPYREFHGLPIRIHVSANCSNCGTCIRKCPTQAISRTDPKITDQERCIGCMRCIQECPVEGRSVSRLVRLVVRQKLKKVCAGRKEPEFFV